jgi:uncharacterized protein YbbK (DUF523 family)
MALKKGYRPLSFCPHMATANGLSSHREVAKIHQGTDFVPKRTSQFVMVGLDCHRDWTEKHLD